MRLIDADALLDKMMGTSRYFSIKYDIDEAPTIEVEDLKDASYYRDRYEIVCRINGDMSKSVGTYHKLFMMNQAEIENLKAKIAELEGKLEGK